MENQPAVKVSTGSKIKKLFTDWILPILIAVVIALLVKKFLLYQVSVPSSSMSPTIEEGDKFMIEKVYNPSKLKRGDIVVFQSDELNDTLIKRLIGLPNDHIEIKDGVVSINGEVLSEDYVNYPSDGQINKKTDGTFDVPEGEYFFLGDNRANSYDSRYWKNHYIDQSDIKGKLLFRSYPFSKFGTVK